MKSGDLGEHNLDRLIGELYDAALAPGLWSSWIASAATVFASDTGALQVQDPSSAQVDVLGSLNHSAESWRFYGEYYHTRDLWIQRALPVPMQVKTSADIVSDIEFANSEFYTDFLKPHSIGQFYIAGALIPLGREIGVLGLQRTRQSGEFTARAAQALQRILPHLRRALQVRSRLQGLEAESAAGYEALDTLAHGIFLVTPDSRVVFANRAAEELARAKDGLAIGEGRILVGARPADTQRLHALISGASGGHGAVQLPRPSGLRPLEVIAMPLGPRALDMRLARATTIVLVRDPEMPLPAMPELLQDLYRFTPAEAGLVVALVAGTTLQEYSVANGVSYNTARTLLARAMARTETRSQTDLVRLVMGSLTTLRAGSKPPK